ncbi:MAG: DNA mismatch repair protein MutS [Gemmatimonadetes bacterium]|nr:DNA mismatch repair protein MutS [Gemmatimonadota bacterium]
MSPRRSARSRRAVAGSTPLIEQYREIKARHADSMLFFRVGDFYEMFFEDAEEASGLLGIALASRNNGPIEVPLAGVPAKALNEYLPRLIEAGRRVAICEQLEEVAEADGIVRRDVVEIVTPGTVVDPDQLTRGRNNFVVAVAAPARSTGAAEFGLAVADLSTGEFELRGCGDPDALRDDLSRLDPAEVLLPQRLTVPADPAETLDAAITGSQTWVTTSRPDWLFDPATGEERLQSRFGVHSAAGFGIDPRRDQPLLAAASALLAYLDEVRPGGVKHLRPPRVDRTGRVMHLDEMTRRNLELVEPLRPGEGVTLLSLLDQTKTPMGARLMRRRVLRPLLGQEEIETRLDAVADLVAQSAPRRAIREHLSRVRDLERAAAHVSGGKCEPRRLLALANSLVELPGALENASKLTASRLVDITKRLDPLDDTRSAIEEALDAGDGSGTVREGHSRELDQLRSLRDEAAGWIRDLQERERRETGIESLKVGFNKVFGYYIEVTRTRVDQVPDRFIRKQTLAGSERYFTTELKEWEEKVLAADREIEHLEAQLLRALVERLGKDIRRIQQTAAAVSELDVLAALAHVSVRNDWTRPEITLSREIQIEQGRHPVVEAALGPGEFVAGDTRLDSGTHVLLVTGPNMSGKSTVLRQVGIIALMAHTGSFVPARRARIGLCDRVFTRVGASDNLASGMSTFMVEMTETATILNSATDRSLVLLDEIGRGTSTYDGVSIACAVTERLHEVGARTLFATHYHELVGLAESLPRAAALNVAVRETEDSVIFLHRLEPGGCDRSYGVHVAKLAGLPRAVVARAAQILRALESGPWGVGGRSAMLGDFGKGQLSLFLARAEGAETAGGADHVAEPDGPLHGTGPRPEPGDPAAGDVLDQLRKAEPDRLTPLEALNLVAELKSKLSPER